MLVSAEVAQAPLVREVARALDGEVACTGPDRNSIALLAENLQTDRHDDLRTAIHGGGTDLILLADPNARAPDVLRAIRDSGIPAIALHPVLDSFPEVVTHGDSAVDCAPLVPLFRSGPGMTSALTFLAEFGSARSLSVTMRFDSGVWSVLSRLYDALDLVASLLGECDQIDAAVSGDPRRAPIATAPESVGGIQGDVTLHARGPGERSAVVYLTQRPGDWFRGATIVTECGTLRVTDDRCDQIGEPTTDDRRCSPSTPAALIAAEAQRILGGSSPAPGAPAASRIMALCEAARLSCRTRSSESTMRLLELVG